VRERTASRAAANACVLESRHSETFLGQQLAYATSEYPQAIGELRGLSDGFGVSFDVLFALLHLQVLRDMEGIDSISQSVDGCTVWAGITLDHKVIIAKNRDTDPEESILQRIFWSKDPAWNGRSVLSVGTLGCPFVYSSAINSDGFALADTAVGTTDHGVGMHKIFTMCRLASQCPDVKSALRIINNQKNTGGGSVVMGDVSSIAVVELGHGASECSHQFGGWIARTNHFVSPRTRLMCRMDEGLSWIRSSQARYLTISSVLTDLNQIPSPEAIFELMSAVGITPDGHLCRTGIAADARTISTAVFETAIAAMSYIDDPVGAQVRCQFNVRDFPT